MILKTIFGMYYALGSNPKEIIGPYLSCWNFGGINGELLDLGEPNIFQYFLTTKEAYINARSKNLAFHWPHKYKGKRGGCFKLCKIKAEKEFNSFKEENFLTNETFENNEFSTGWIPRSLELINLEKVSYQETKQEIIW